MRKTVNYPKIVIILLDFILPLPMTLLMFWLWYLRTQNTWFAAYTLCLGICFGYVVPGIGTNLLGLWRFLWPFKIGRYFIHHGFMFAPYFSLTFFVCFGSWETLSAAQAITIVITTAVIQGSVSTLHDITGIKAGMMEIYNAQSRDRKSAEEIVMADGPLGFALFGAAYALFCLIGYHFFVTEMSRSIWLFAGLTAAGTTVMGVTGIPYIIKHRAFIGSAGK